MGCNNVALLDDEVSMVRLLERTLDRYDVQAFTDARGFLNSLRPETDCILLDIQMPGCDGYEVCRLLRARDATRHTPILFVSGQSSLQHRLQGYAAGADDFITKPFDIAEVRAKVERALLSKEQREILQSSADEARQAAFEAMTHSAEQGEISRFIEQAMSCKSPEQLASVLIASLKNLGLNAVVACWSGPEFCFVSHSGGVRPLEAELLRTCREGARIIELEKRMVVNFGLASILIKNAPCQEAARYGRIKDHLCVIMSSVHARLQSLLTEQQLHRQQQLLRVVDDVEYALQNLQQRQNQGLNLARETVQDLNLELSEELLLLNLDPDQEQHLTHLVRDHMDTLERIYRSCADLTGPLQPVLQTLADIAGQRLPDRG
ncbi:MAG: response regulator [Saccharospirillaceae bacterium]|nr:response regulator [Saccharospirillaceae bacterium]MCD8532251.1 response regulator [Saccharospirillaceae bacterium]